MVCVESGDVVPADARLLECGDLEVDESGLTGESQAVAKDVAATPGAVLADRTCMLHEGTSVVAGRGRAVVVAVGAATAGGPGDARPPVSPRPRPGVQARLGELTRVGAAADPGRRRGRRRAVAAVAAPAARRRSRPGVAVAVAAVPEGLPLVATVAQQAAARRLSRRGAVVRNARVLEALGRVDTVCFDKTGTLTENRLRVVRLVPLDGRRATTSCWRWPRWRGDPADAHVHEVDRAVAEAAARRRTTGPRAACRSPPAAGSPPACATAGWSSRARPRSCSTAARTPATPAQRVERLAAEGLRVIAVADRQVDGVPDDLPDATLAALDLDAAAHDLTLRGLVALADGVRDSTTLAVAQLRAAGVRVLVATGDHPETASAIAAEAGIPDADRVVTGAEFLRASDAERVRMVRETAVFARLSPGAEGGARGGAAQGRRDAGDDRRRRERRRGDPARRRRGGRRGSGRAPSRPPRAAPRTWCSPTPT